MITAGVDIGSTTTKVAILDDAGRLLAREIVPTGPLPAETARRAFADTLAKAGLRADQIETVATTGYGRRLVDFGDMVLTEIRACATGVVFGAPAGSGIRTVIDVGGQDTKVIALTDSGDIEDFGMNDKCAAGTGRFLQVLADKLGVDYAEFVRLALTSDGLIHMNSTCAVFAESEAVGLLARGASKADIASAAHHAIAGRIASMVRRVSHRGEYAFVGGGSLNAALVRTVSEALNAPVHVPADPQLAMALGAAVCARNRKTPPAV